jgi:hypothetical protein
MSQWSDRRCAKPPQDDDIVDEMRRTEHQPEHGKVRSRREPKPDHKPDGTPEPCQPKKPQTPNHPAKDDVRLNVRAESGPTRLIHTAVIQYSANDKHTAADRKPIGCSHITVIRPLRIGHYAFDHGTSDMPP